MKTIDNITIENNVVTECTIEKTVTTSATKDSPKIEMAVVFNFKGVSIEKIFQWAVETLVIRAQARFRKYGEDWMRKNLDYTIDVSDFFSGERVGKSKEQITREYVKSLSPEEKAKLLAELTGM